MIHVDINANTDISLWQKNVFSADLKLNIAVRLRWYFVVWLDYR